MSRTRGRGRLGRAAAVAVALPLASGALIAAAPAAGAAVNQPVEGAEYTSNRPVDIEANYGVSSGPQQLFLTSPGGPEVEVASAAGGPNGGTLSYTLDLVCWTKDCSGTRLAPNGQWTIRQAGSSTDSSSFVTRIRPEAPTAVTASQVNPRQMRVSWRLGAEPDLTGWTVLEGSAVVQDDIGRSACDGTTCSAVISYASEGSGEHTYTVRAFRATAPGATTTLESPLSSPATGRLEAAPPSPAPSPSEPGGGGETGGGGGEGDGSGGSGTGGSQTGGSGGSGGSTGGGGTSPGGSSSGPAAPGTSGSGTAPLSTGDAPAPTSVDDQAVAQRRAFALGFSTFGPKLGIPKLPPLPQAQEPSIAPELADGTFEPTLGFEEQERIVRERVETAASEPRTRTRSVVSTAIDSERLLRSSAAALVLLLAGAHLRRWLGASREEH